MDLETKSDLIRKLVVEGQLLEDFQCPICMDLILDPKECTECNQQFCHDCLLSWLAEHGTYNSYLDHCPISRNKQMNYSEPHRFFRNSYDRIRLSCPNKNGGCQEQFSITEFDKHKSECDYEMQRCKNDQCFQMFIRLKIKEHEQNECNYRIITCPHCNEQMAYMLRQTHNCIASLTNRFTRQQEQINNVLIEQIKSQQSTITGLTSRVDTLSNQVLTLKKHMRQLNNICLSGHTLSWKIKLQRKDCHQCQRKLNTRYCCGKCKEHYCVSCKPPVILQNKCPLDHLFESYSQYDRDIECDLCGLRPFNSNTLLWADLICDLQICDSCYNK